jgi:anaerobic ribonucleoside-triphosphate reductase activating protein
MVNGAGLRTVIWVSGCEHHCPNCFNEETHDPNSGIVFDEEAKQDLFKDLNEDWCDGITFTGGDPLHKSNFLTVLNLCKEIKEKHPTKTIWLYTGFTWEYLIDNPEYSVILHYVDVLCEGPYVEALKDPNIKWVGSSNQRVIDVAKRFRTISQIASETI